MKIIISYIPVLHEGYRRFIEKNKDSKTLYIFGKEIIDQFDHLAKEIRALDPNLMKKAILSLGILPTVKILKLSDLKNLNHPETQIVLPNEDVTSEIAKKYLNKANVFYDQVFLRWDKHNSMASKSVNADQKISFDTFDQNLIQRLKDIGETKSSDWWRRIGAAIVKDKKIILVTFNRHIPSQHSPYANGDPRNNFHKGVYVELSTALHAEAGLISEAAKRGISLKGKDLFVNTFPCPYCAKLIAYCGISRLYYGGGYGVLDGEAVLKSQGVEIIFVDLH